LKRAMSGGRGEKGGDDDGGKGGNKKGGSRGNSKSARSRNNSSGKKKGEGKNAAPAAADPAELERRLNQLQSRPQWCAAYLKGKCDNPGCIFPHHEQAMVDEIKAKNKLRKAEEQKKKQGKSE